MESWAILEIAARHYTILKCLDERDCDYGELVKATKIGRSSISNYIKEMVEAGLVEEKARLGRKKSLTILEKGKITLNYIRKYDLLIYEPTFDEKLRRKLDDILEYYKKGYQIEKVEELVLKELIILCSDNPDAIFYETLQKFFKEYLTQQISSRDINELLQRNIRSIMQNFCLKTWFYQEIFPILSEQVTDIKTDHRVRNIRVSLLWEIFRLDEDNRDKILEIFIKIIKTECINKEEEICKYICSSYQPDIEGELYQRLLKLDVNEEIMRAFFSSN